MRLNNSFSKLLTVTAIVGSSLTFVSLSAPEAQACNSGLSRLDPTCRGRIFGPSGGSGSSSSGGGSQSQVGGPGWAELNRTQSFRLINQSGQTVNYLYVSPSNRSDWGPDILGNSVLSNGYQWNTDLRTNSNGCRYDVRAVLADGRESTAYGYDVCSSRQIFIR